MTTRTILLTLAATVAPLYAQQPTTPAPAAQPFTALAAPASQAEVATPEQRARVFNALALLPQNISDFCVLTNIGGNLLQLANSGKLPELTPSDLPAEIVKLDNIAIATTPATPQTYALLRHTLVGFSTLSSTMQLSSDWATQVRPELIDPIVESLILSADNNAAQASEAAESSHLPASYLVITCQPGEEAMLQESYSQLLTELRDGSKPGITPVDDAQGFSGVRMNLAEAYASELELATKDMAPRRKAQLLESLNRQPLHILARQQGNALIIAVCADPQELRLAASPAESLLATEKLAACDANLGKGMIAAVLISPELAEVGNAVNSQPTLELANGISATFTQLGEQEPDHKPTYEQAAAAVRFMAAELGKLTRPITRPSFMQVWCDGDLLLCLTGDAQGCSYQPGELRLTAMAQEPATSLYTESTPLHSNLTPPDAKVVLEAALDAAEGFALTLADEKRAQASMSIKAVEAFQPELRSLASAGNTICNGLNGQLAFVMDSAYAPIPAAAGVQPGVQAHTPRLALFAGVSDRSKLGEGWEELRAAAGQVAVKLGVPAEMVNLLPISSRQEGAATCYSINLPFFTQDAVPSVAVTDSGLALGSSTNLTTRVVNSATGTLPFAGAVFALNFKPLARTLRSLATALDHDAEEAEPAASSEVRLEREKSVPVAVVGGATGPTSVFVNTRTTDIEDAADALSTAAAITEFASTIAEGLYGTSTIENGQHTIHVQLKMKN